MAMSKKSKKVIDPGTFPSIIRRNGVIVPFDTKKIRDATFRANIQIADERISGDALNKLANSVIASMPTGEIPTMEQIQNKMGEKLIAAGYAKTAKTYIIYRAEHTKIRKMDQNLMKIYEDLTFKPPAKASLEHESANIDADTAISTTLKHGSEDAKCFYNTYVLPPDIAQAYRGSDIYIHDMDFCALTETCCQIDLIKLFHGGFSTGHGFLREPNDVRSYAALACTTIQANRDEMYGGQSVPNFDYAMVMGVAKTFRKAHFRVMIQYLHIKMELSLENAALLVDKIKHLLAEPTTLGNMNNYRKVFSSWLPEHQRIHRYQEINWVAAATAHNHAHEVATREADDTTYQTMEALIHNLNTMNFRADVQVPLSSVNYETDASSEGRMTMRNMLLATDCGLGEGETVVFPIQIFEVKEGVSYNKGNPDYDLFQLACRVSAKRLFPNFSFIDAPYDLQYYRSGHPETEITYMGCRTHVVGNVHDEERQVVNGHEDLNFTPINPPCLGVLAEGNLDKFYELLDDRINLVMRQPLHHFKVQCGKKVYNYPFLMGQDIWIDSDKLDVTDGIAGVLRHDTLSIGSIGLAEAPVALIGKHHGESEEAQKLGLEIIGYMRKRVEDESAHTGLSWNLLATPVEGLFGRFVEINQKRLGELPGITDRAYYISSFRVPVYYPISAYKETRLEAPYHALANTGHINYVEMDGDTYKDLEAFESIIRCMKEAGIGYGSVSHPVDRNPVCDFNGIINNECPKCHRHEGEGVQFERIRHITGYLVGTTDHWNNAKRAEEHDRVKHSCGCTEEHWTKGGDRIC